MLQRGETTIVLADNKEFCLSHLAVADTVDKFWPAEVHIWTDRDRWPPAVDYGVPTFYFELSLHATKLQAIEAIDNAYRKVRTPKMLLLQWDAGISDPSLWDNAYLGYDYIGAPWPSKVVGNSGFCLASTALFAKARELFPHDYLYDDVICHKLRPTLEAHGFRWAPYELADKFAIERAEPHPTFGYHGCFNWPSVMGKVDVLKRMNLATDYAKGRREWTELLHNNRVQFQSQ